MNDTRDLYEPASSKDGTAGEPSSDPGKNLRPRGVPPWLLGLTLGLLLVVLTVFVFEQLADILKPLFIAGFLVYLIMPVHRFLVRLKVPTVVSYVVLVAVIVTAGFVAARIVANSFSDLKGDFPKYEAKIDGMRVKVEGVLDRVHSWLNPRRGEHDHESGGGAAVADRNPTAPSIREEPRAEIISRDFLSRQLTAVLSSFKNLFLAVMVVVIYLAFLLAEMEGIQRRVAVVFGKQRGQEVLRVFDDVNRAISRYISVKVFISFLVGFLTTVVLGVFGVPFFLLWGVLTFLFNFIPYVGSIVAAVPPIVLTLLNYGLGWQVVAVALLLIAIQNVVGYVVEPRMTGRKLNVSPLLTLLGLAFWGWLWGVVGMILAVPLVVSLKIVFEHIDATKPIAGLMSGAPPAPGPADDPAPSV